MASSSSSRLLVATASSSRLSTAPRNAPRRRSASTRAAQLASAAQASQLQTSEEAPPLPLAQSQYLGVNAGEDGLAEDDESSPPYTSAQLRLSPLGRLSKWQDSGPRLLPRPFIDAVDDEIRAGNGKLIRRDLKEVLSTAFDPRDSTAPIKTGRQALLSLAKDSAARYAAIRQVLGTVEQRLSQGEESWSPTHVVDVGSARAEGLWAAADVWPSTLRTWTGKESSTANIKVAKSLLARNAENEGPHPVHKVHRNFETLREGAANVSIATDVPGKTLLLSSHRLLALPSDSHREQHVKKLWRSGAETIVLIEEGSDRGFAAIASARALLLELGEESKQAGASAGVVEGEDAAAGSGRESAPGEKLVLGGIEFHEERPEDRRRAIATTSSPTPAQGSWIVAPCPHDRPCPLLHPFSLSHPHEARPSSTRSPTRTRLSRHHEAEHVGLSSCLHPVRFLPPRWSTHEVVEKRRRQREKGGREERSARVAYVVVKRGERPSIARLQGEERRAVVEAAKEARKGILDELRKGDSLMPRRLPEDVVGEGEDSEEAQRELLKLLPGALKEAGASGEESEEALRHVLAQMGALQEGNTKGEDVWAASSELAEAQEEEAVDEEAAAAQEANEDWLRAATNVDLDTPATSSSSALPYLLSSLPRIVLPPIKKGGHVTFDACHSNGSIQRYTIAKSAGKQVYQEARKSAWADLWSQDPVEAIAMEEQEEGEGPLEVVDERTGKRGWVKRKGWGQWYRISAAAPEGMGAMSAAAAMPAGRASSIVTSQDGRTWVVEEEEEVLDEEDGEDAALAEEEVEDGDDVEEVDVDAVAATTDPFSLDGTAWATDPSLLSTSKNARIKGSPSPASRKGSSRPSAAIGADQVCPRPPVPGGDDRVAEYRKTRGGERKQAKHAYRREIQQALRETAAAERGAFVG